MRKIWLVFLKSLREMVREPQLLILTLLFPFFMLVIIYIGYNTPKLATYTVLLVGEDQPGAAELTAMLRAQRYPDGRPIFNLTPAADRAAAEAALKKQAATALLILAPDSQLPLKATIYGDATSMRFITASTLLQNLIVPLLDAAAGKPEVVKLAEQPLDVFAPQTDLDVYSPGMMLFAILLLTPQTAMLVAREMRWGTLHRLRLSALRMWELLAGISLAQMAVGACLVIVMFACALAMGFHNHGSLALAVGISLLLTFSAIGFGLVVACFSSNDGDALNIGGVCSMLQVFLCGSFFPLPPLTVFTVAGHEIGAFDFIPATHGLLALQQVLISGAGFGQVAFRLAAALGLSLFYFGVGIVIFSWRQRRRWK
jgi:ABC-type transport system involved in multi-copper enzyme maturation permease subunit